MAGGPEMQPACQKFLRSMLEKLVMLSPQVANFLLFGLGFATRPLQKLKEEEAPVSLSLHNLLGT